MAAAQEELAFTLETMTEGFTSYDPDYRITQCNSETERFLGRPRKEFIGKNAAEVFPSPDRLKFQAHYNRIMETGIPERFEESYEGHWLQVHAYRTRNGGVAVFHRDITEQKLNQDRIVASEQLLDQVFTESPICLVVVMGRDFVFHRANQKYLELIGKTDILGKKAVDVLPELEAQGFIALLNQVFESKKTFTATEIPIFINLPGSSQKTIYMDMYYQPLLDSKGEVFGILGQATDVTDKVLAQKNLQKSKERSDFLAKASSVLNSSLDVKKVLQLLADLSVPRIADWCSIQFLEENGALKLAAVSHKEPEKVKWAWELQSQYASKPDAKQGSRQVIRTGRSEIINGITDDMLAAVAQNEDHLKLLSQVGFHSYMCVPIRTREKVIGALSLITTHESKRSYTEEDLQLAQETAVRAGVAFENARLYNESQNINRRKDEFLATLSHELRTPMNVILGYADILKTEISNLSPEELESSIDAIHRNALTQTALIGDLLDVSSIITGKVSFQPQPLSPADTIQTICKNLLPAAEAKGVEFHCEFSKAPELISADPTRLYQIIWNLASNALKFTERGDRIDLIVENSNSSWTLKVKDTGKGIDPEFLPHVFDRFTQEDSSTTRSFGGMGLGLSIVQFFVHLHGGKIEVHSSGKGQGSTFTATFPLSVSQPVNDLKTKSVLSKA